MSGHSKWSSIKHKKAKVDAQRGKVFTKLIKEITTAARESGGDENTNPRLRTAIVGAKGMNMPAANIERAVKKGTGELPGVTYESIAYEGYGPAGVAILIDCLTDNKNRSVSEVRFALGKHNGSMGEAGSVSWMFEMKGQMIVTEYDGDEDSLMEIALDAGAEDLTFEDGTYEIITAPEDFVTVKEALDTADVKCESAQVAKIPKTSVEVKGNDIQKVINLIEALEELDDVQDVFTNFDFDPEELEEEV